MSENKLDSKGGSGGEKLREDALRDNDTHFHAHTHPAGTPAQGILTKGHDRSQSFKVKEKK